MPDVTDAPRPLTPAEPAPRPLGLEDCPRPGGTAASTDQPRRHVDLGWLQWIAENRLRRCSPESMADTMVRSGIDAVEAQAAIQAMESDPGYQAGLKMRQLRDKLASVMGNLQKLWESDPLYDHVEKRSRLSQDEFVTRYVRGCRPVVLTDIARDWPAMQRWSPAYLKERFGHLAVEIQAERGQDQLYEVNKLKHKREVKLGDFVDRVLAMGVSNDEYLTANNELLRRPEFAPLLADIGTLPPYCDRSKLAERASFWFGPAGTVTPLHHDTLMLFHTQVVGRKRWRFISPLETPRLYNHYHVYSAVNLDNVDLSRHPDFAQVKVLDVVVEPGETMFLPLAWWHQVSSLDVSLSFSFSNLSVPNQFEYVHAEITNW